MIITKSIDLKNNLSGFYNLGFIYENGYGVDVNYAKAYEIYNEGKII